MNRAPQQQDTEFQQAIQAVLRNCPDVEPNVSDYPHHAEYVKACERWRIGRTLREELAKGASS